MADLLDEGHRKSVPGDNAMVHQLHEGGQSEGQQVAKTTRQHTHTNTHIHHRKLLFGRWLGLVYSCKAQMAWNITRNERSAETKRWQGAGETGEKKFKKRKKEKFNVATKLAGERPGERKECDAERTDRPARTSGGSQKVSRR